MILEPILVLIGLAVWAHRRRLGAPGRLEHGAARYGDDPAVAGGTAWALARFEARCLVHHPAFVTGAVLSLLAMRWAGGGDPPSFADSHFNHALSLVPLGWFTLLAANMNVLRSRRHGTAELVESLPSTSGTRTAGHLLAAMGGMAVAAVMIVLWLVLCLWVLSVSGTPDAVQLAFPLLLVGGGAVVGVAVARWLPFVGFGFVAISAVTWIQVLFMGSEDNPPGGVRFLGFVPESDAINPLLDSQAKWHVVYLLGLTVVMAGVALIRHGRSRVAVMTLVIGALLAVSAGWIHTRPRGPLAAVGLTATTLRWRCGPPWPCPASRPGASRATPPS